MELPWKGRCKSHNIISLLLAMVIQTAITLECASNRSDHLGYSYREVSRIMDFDWKTLSDGFEEPVDDIQGIMADPPWAFIVEDGRNDGACKLTPNEFVRALQSPWY